MDYSLLVVTTSGLNQLGLVGKNVKELRIAGVGRLIHMLEEAQPVRINRHCCCVDRTELVLGCGIPEVRSMLFLMKGVKVGHELLF
jgi:hypothetical protein